MADDAGLGASTHRSSAHVAGRTSGTGLRWRHFPFDPSRPRRPFRDRHPRANQDVQAVHRRRVRRGGRRPYGRGHQPGHGPADRDRAGELRRGCGPGRQRGRDGLRVVEEDDAPGPLAAPAQDRRCDRGQGRRARPARECECRQAGRRRHRRDGRVRRPVPLLRRRRPGHGRPGRQRVRGRPHVDHPARPDRRRGLDRAVELPALHGQLEARAGARDRQHGRPQAIRPHAADGPRLRRDRVRDPAARRRQRPVRLGRRYRRRAGRPSEGPHGLDHRGHRDRQARREDRGRQRQAAPPRARWQGAGHRVRRCRRRSRGRDAALRRVLELRPGLHGGDPRPRRPGRLRQVRRRRWPTRSRRSSGAIRPRATTSRWAR